MDNITGITVTIVILLSVISLPLYLWYKEAKMDREIQEILRNINIRNRRNNDKVNWIKEGF